MGTENGGDFLRVSLKTFPVMLLASLFTDTLDIVCLGGIRGFYLFCYCGSNSQDASGYSVDTLDLCMYVCVCCLKIIPRVWKCFRKVFVF